MSQAGYIDGFRFARERGRRAGHLSLDVLSRLPDFGCVAAEVDYVLEGTENDNRHLSLRIAVDGELQLVCQRCLEPVSTPVAVRCELELSADQHYIDTVDDDVERVLATSAMDVAALVEDELILDLPIIAMHEQCGAGLAEEDAKPSPFAALAALRRGKPGND